MKAITAMLLLIFCALTVAPIFILIIEHGITGESSILQSLLDSIKIK